MSRFVDSILKNTSTKHRLKKFRNVLVKFNERERFILEEFDECCVTVLTDTGFNNNHCVVIDGRNKLIYDPAEKRGLQLTKENLNRCCGQGYGFRSTSALYSIINRGL